MLVDIKHRSSTSQIITFGRNSPIRVCEGGLWLPLNCWWFLFAWPSDNRLSKAQAVTTDRQMPAYWALLQYCPSFSNSFFAGFARQSVVEALFWTQSSFKVAWGGLNLIEKCSDPDFSFLLFPYLGQFEPLFRCDFRVPLMMRIYFW